MHERLEDSFDLDVQRGLTNPWRSRHAKLEHHSASYTHQQAGESEPSSGDPLENHLREFSAVQNAERLLVFSHERGKETLNPANFAHDEHLTRANQYTEGRPSIRVQREIQ